MSAQGLDVFDKTLQTTHIWLNEVMEEIGPDRQVAWHVLGGVLHALRDRLPPDLATHLGSQLPILVRGAYYDQWQPAGKPDRIRSLDEFLERIQEEISGTRPVNAGTAAEAVFGVLVRHVNRGQIDKVVDALPEDLRPLWMATTEARSGPDQASRGSAQ